MCVTYYRFRNDWCVTFAQSTNEGTHFICGLYQQSWWAGRARPERNKFILLYDIQNGQVDGYVHMMFLRDGFSPIVNHSIARALPAALSLLSTTV